MTNDKEEELFIQTMQMAPPVKNYSPKQYADAQTMCY